MDLPINRIIPRSDARVVDHGAVAALADSIASVGLINPIRVREAGDGWEVIAGVHRLEACKSLGLVEIAAHVVADDDLHAELAMIDENLCRAELSPSDRARQTARRKAIYEALHPETGHGKASPNKDENFSSFAGDTASKTGVTERIVQLHAERGAKILDEALDLIKGTKLDTGTYLDKIKKMPGSEQMKVVERDLAFIRQQEREQGKIAAKNKVQADVKARAAKAVAEWLVENANADAVDFLKSNLYAAGASNIAHELTNLTGEAIMDRRFG